MKLLLVVASDDTYDLISLYIRPLGFDLIRYRHIIKAMDNVDEADPAGVIISANDFPRHWKAMVQFIRAERPKEICPVIILTGKKFPLEATTQAFYIGVSGIVDETLSTPDLDRLQTIISRYIPVDERRRDRRFYAAEWNRFGLLISNPKNKTIISGEIKNISASGLSFSPAYSSLMNDIGMHTILPQC
ncbi:MAG: PilZ domain-containing protein, partial [Treponema sp.]|nr:PilZ domain-containing protein [Treponema sp.]